MNQTNFGRCPNFWVMSEEPSSETGLQSRFLLFKN